MSITTIDGEFAIPVYSSVCSLCKHLRIDQGRTCDAYPKRDNIPMEIWMGENDHRQPFPGDHGIRFESVHEDSGA